MRGLNAHFGAALLFTAFPAVASAHTGVDAHSGFGAGILHPLVGPDHLAAMLLVGLIGFEIGGRARWLVPASFVAAMGLGGAVGMTADAVPFTETVVALSVLVLGIALAASGRVPLALAAMLAAVFGLFHGHAHGTEMPDAASALPYALGFLTATALLHLGGFALGGALQSAIAGPRLARALGIPAIALGALLTAGTF